MALNNDPLNALNLMEDALRREIQQVLVDRITDDLVAEFREKVEPIVRQQAERVTLHGITRFKDLAKLRDELRVYLKWSDGKKSGPH
jgi:hypothetical protein